MLPTTLCYCLKDDQVLLAMKKRGFGMGKWNGYGGKVNVAAGETIPAGAVRELKEESGLDVEEKNLEHVATVRFYFAGDPFTECTVYICRTWKGEPIETEEMRPQWFATNALPFSEMWAADTDWLPKVLKGEKVEADIYFNKEGNVVEKIEYK